jgi:hypothetical protein
MSEENTKLQPTQKARRVAAEFLYLKSKVGGRDEIALDLMKLMVADNSTNVAKQCWAAPEAITPAI